jgi:hypothetical protein
VHPDRNMITRSLGGRADIDIDLTRHFVRPGDVLVLCSDGLSGHVSDQEILNIATGNRPQKAAKKLIDLANRRGGTDNISVIVVRVPGRPARERTARQRKASQALVLGSMGLVLVGIAAALVLVLNPELYRRDGAVEPSATPTLAEQTTTEALPTATPTLTPTHTPTLVPTSTRAPTLTFTPTPEPPTDTPTPEPTATPQHTPTHTPVSEETPTNTPEP